MNIICYYCKKTLANRGGAKQAQFIEEWGCTHVFKKTGKICWKINKTTFCKKCAQRRHNICPKCGGHLRLLRRIDGTQTKYVKGDTNDVRRKKKS